MGIVKYFDWLDIYKEATQLLKLKNKSGRRYSLVVMVKVLHTTIDKGSYCVAETFGENALNYRFQYPGCGCCSGEMEGKIVGYRIQLYDADLQLANDRSEGAL